MNPDMTLFTQTDYIQIYERGLETLKARPGDRKAQHSVVLSLARLGALDFALEEYARYGLDEVDNDEDIMALAGRLTKDFYSKTGGVEAIQYAKHSAGKYDAAFQKTKGYYSGINAATMALMADMPEAVIADRAKAILDILPPADMLTATEHYFIEATRAEAHLLLGKTAKAKVALTGALAFDPLNYTAHASTLKQFHMISAKRGYGAEWLSEFSPPRPVYYAGHIDLMLEELGEDGLSFLIADILQKRDIGFGFGALAAGSDIIFAETLLGEGAELHVVLPCAVDAFENLSVTPFGADWTARYRACLSRAASLTVTAPNASWPDARVNRFSGQFAMGQAALRGQIFGADPLQVLTWDGNVGGSYTALHSRDWTAAGREQIIIPVKSSTPGTPVSGADIGNFPAVLKRRGDTGFSRFETISGAMEAAVSLSQGPETVRLALHIEIPGDDAEVALQNILESSVPGSLFMSEAFAGLLAHFAPGQYDISFAGSAGKTMRCYAPATGI